MPSDTDLELLNAHADGELPPDERARVEALLAGNPSLQKQLDNLRRLNALARAEAGPALPNADEHWSAVQAALNSNDLLDRTARIAPVPNPDPQRFDAVWTRVQSRTVLNPRVARRAEEFAIPPQVGTQRWKRVWFRILGQTHAPVPRESRRIGWTFAVAAGMAACVLVVALTRPYGKPNANIQSVATHSAPQRAIDGLSSQAERPTAIAVAPTSPKVVAPPVELTVARVSPPSPVASMQSIQTTLAPLPELAALEVPESLDERYEVAVKYNPGDDSPIIHVYLKSPPDSEVRSTESVVPAQ